jgi:hypothetical protein
MGRKINLTGQTFGRLTVLEEAGRDKKGQVRWLCVCDDGNKLVVTSSDLRNGHTQSCGCLRRELAAERMHKHGHTFRRAGSSCSTPEYKAWQNARERCNNPNVDNYVNYGGRGIKFLFTSFEEFFAEVGPRPSPAHSIDRINNDGHYAPGNVRWATAKEQANNKRRRRDAKAAA